MQETMSGAFPDFPVQSEVVNSDDVRVSKKQITDTGDKSSSAHELLTNDNLLIEILLRLPIISIIIFKLVSKRWLSLITSPDFIMRQNLIPNVDPPSGLFLQRRHESSILRDFMSLDPRITSRKSPLRTSFTFGSSEAGNDVQFLQPCNGLLLCHR
ncbi:F-box protein-like protein isoform X1 [Tanacetum coccineum]